MSNQRHYNLKSLFDMFLQGFKAQVAKKLQLFCKKEVYLTYIRLCGLSYNIETRNLQLYMIAIKKFCRLIYSKNRNKNILYVISKNY